jgi:hypothetical protein
MTIDAWVNPNSVAGYRTIVLEERPAQLSHGLYRSTNTSRL